MAPGRKLDEPKGYALVTFLSTAMLVAGVGLAWTGLLLAAAGIVLSIIEFKELQRLNPWLLPDDPADSPLSDPAPRRVMWASVATTVVAMAFAIAVERATDEPLTVLGPAVIGGLTGLFFNAQFRTAVQAGGGEQPGHDDAGRDDKGD